MLVRTPSGSTVQEVLVPGLPGTVDALFSLDKRCLLSSFRDARKHPRKVRRTVRVAHVRYSLDSVRSQRKVIFHFEPILVEKEIAYL